MHGDDRYATLAAKAREARRRARDYASAGIQAGVARSTASADWRSGTPQKPAGAVEMILRRIAVVCLAAICLMACTSAGARAQQTLWRANEDSGSYAAWNLGEYGGQFNSGVASSKMDATHAHTGSHSLKMTSDSTRGPAGTRNFRWSIDRMGTPLPQTAVYTAWFYWDKVYTPTLFWSIMQWKTRTDDVGGNKTDWTLDLANNGHGMYLQWFDLHQRLNHHSRTSNNSIQPNKWYKVEVIFRFDETDGSVVSYLNGDEWFSISGVATQWPTTSTNPRYRQWSINNYTSQNTPDLSAIWVDDVSIGRLGGSNPRT